MASSLGWEMALGRDGGAEANVAALSEADFVSGEDGMLEELLVVVDGVVHAVMRAAALEASEGGTGDEERGVGDVASLAAAAAASGGKCGANVFELRNG